MKAKPTPSVAVIFISKLHQQDGYAEAAARMVELGSQQPGFLGIESVRHPDGRGITVVFYESAEAAKAWGRNPEHRTIQQHGKKTWYESFEIYYANVESGRAWEAGEKATLAP